MPKGDDHAGWLQERKFSKEKMDGGSVEVGDEEVNARGRKGKKKGSVWLSLTERFARTIKMCSLEKSN